MKILRFVGTLIIALSLWGSLPVAAQVDNPAIEVLATVSLDPAVCGTVTEITVAAGTEVYICYVLSNTGNVNFGNLHLEDNVGGVIVPNLALGLFPGLPVNTTSLGFPFSYTFTSTTTVSSTWTASDGGFGAGGVSAADIADVTINIAAPTPDPTPVPTAVPTPDPTASPNPTVTVVPTATATDDELAFTGTQTNFILILSFALIAAGLIVASMAQSLRRKSTQHN